MTWQEAKRTNQEERLYFCQEFVEVLILLRVRSTVVGKACHPEQEVASQTAYAVRKLTLQNASVHLSFLFVFSRASQSMEWSCPHVRSPPLNSNSLTDMSRYLFPCVILEHAKLLSNIDYHSGQSSENPKFVWCTHFPLNQMSVETMLTSS